MSFRFRPVQFVIAPIALIVATAGAARGATTFAQRIVPTAAARTFVVRQVNGRGLPFQDHFATMAGYEHRMRVEQAFVRLNGDGTFLLTVHGAYKDAPQDMPGFAGQTRDEDVRGRWTRRGTAITLAFAPSKNGRRVAPAVGQLSGDQLVLRYTIGWDYGVKAGSRAYTLTAAYDPSYL